MKQLNCAYLFLIFVIAFSGCASDETAIAPTWTQTQPPSPTLIPSTSTPTFQPTQTPTLTPPATLEPEQAEDAIRTLLREPVDCSAPCFWEIMPGQTTLGEAINIFTRLGLQLEHTNTRDNKEFYGVIYDFGNGLRVTPVLTIQNDIVQSINVGINPEKQQPGMSREWSAFSPETILAQYGIPTHVEFNIAMGPSDTSSPYIIVYIMTMYFDSSDFVIEYVSALVKDETTLRVCPLTGQYELVTAWFGKNADHIPTKQGAALENATPLTIEQFYDLMQQNPEKACFDLSRDAVIQRP